LSQNGADHDDTERLDFVAAMTHELKTSLTAIIASAELIAEELHAPEGSVQSKLINSIIRNAHRLNERVTFFAEMPRPQVRDFQFQPEPVDIRRVISNVAARLHPQLQERHQSLEIDVPESLPLVHADRQHLEQVLWDLLSNANKFSRDGGEISLSAWQMDRQMVAIRVSDSCGGIPPEEQERIFQPHYQVKPSGSTGGLGLAIARFLVELHGGKIWVESQAGQGCSFFFTLPIFRRAGEGSRHR